MIKMLELLCKIPEHVGWMLVGAVSAYTSVAGWMVGRAIYLAIKERLVDAQEDECDTQEDECEE